MSKNEAAHLQEVMQKHMAEKDMKNTHHQGEVKVKEVAKKKAAQMARQTASEARNKDSEEKALKHHDEQTNKNNHDKMKRAQMELTYKADSENREKKKREAALKVAAKRRVEEEQTAKADKRKQMATAAEMATKNAKESESKLESEARAKAQDEVAHKKDKEKKEKAARETVQKKEAEIIRKTTREHDDKSAQEKSGKAFSLERHNEKKSKSMERIEKILGGLKAFTEKHLKVRSKFDAKVKMLQIIDPVEKTLKTKSKEASKRAKELAAKIKGAKEGNGNCDLGNSLEKLKSKGLLTGTDGQCKVNCNLKPSNLAVRLECAIQGESKATDQCKGFLYTRMQSVATSMIAEFNAYKRCGLNSSGEHVPTEEAMMLGEDDDVHSMPKTIEGGVSVGSYVSL